VRVLIGIIIFLLCYGSVYPFDFYLPQASLVQLTTDLFDTNKRTTYGDMMRNFIIFLPLGAVAAMVVIDRGISLMQKTSSRNTQWLAILGGLLICSIFAVVLQFIQIFLESRVAAIGDAVINVFGYIFGFFATYFIIMQQHHWLEKTRQQPAISLIIAMCWLLYLVFPVYPVITRFDHILSNLLQIFPQSFGVIPELLVMTIGWLFWIEFQKNYRYFSRKNYIWLVATVTLIASSMHNLDWNYSIVIGAILAWHIRRNQVDGKMLLKQRPWPTFFLLVSLLFWLSILDAGPSQSLILLPFDDWLKGHVMANIHFVLRQLFIYACVIYCLRYCMNSRWHRWLICCLLALSIEAFTYYLLGGAASLSQPFLIMLFAWSLIRVELPLVKRTI
jgi:VanZ family protein